MLPTWLRINHANMGPLQVKGAPREVAARITSAISGDSKWTLESRRDSECLIEMHATRTTRLFRFVDDIHIELSALPGRPTQTAARATSRSRIGKADFGQNLRNLRRLTHWMQRIH